MSLIGNIVLVVMFFIGAPILIFIFIFKFISIDEKRMVEREKYLEYLYSLPQEERDSILEAERMERWMERMEQRERYPHAHRFDRWNDWDDWDNY